MGATQRPYDGGSLIVAVAILPLAFTLALAAWGAGLVAVAPVWWGLHRLGVRCPEAASLLGAAATTTVMTPFIFGSGGDIFLAAGVSLSGAAVGLTVWRVAYRRAIGTEAPS
jgi:hypothetical protein